MVIENLPADTDVIITDIAGRVECRQTVTGTLRVASLPTGVHIVRAGGKVAKVMLR